MKSSTALAYASIACVAFWLALAYLLPKIAAGILVGGALGLALAATLPRFLRDPDRDRGDA